MTSMGSPQDLPLRSMDSLDASDRRRLDEAYAAFRGAIDTYFEAEAKSEHYISPDEHLRAVDTAEIVLWSLREKLLDWDRPAHLPPASSVIDWYSPEDAVYDDYEPSAQAF